MLNVLAMEHSACRVIEVIRLNLTLLLPLIEKVRNARSHIDRCSSICKLFQELPTGRNKVNARSMVHRIHI